jgi:5-methylcytosine-specific restriction endonuclease McrA
VRAVSAKRAKANRAKGPVREAVFARDGHQCRLAGVEGAGPCWGPLTVHHVVKASQGGLYEVGNLVSLCAHMNDQIEADADIAAIARSLGLVVRRGD